MEKIVLCIYPLLFLAIFCYKLRVSKKGEYIEDYWSLIDSKSIQVLSAYGVILHHLTQLITKYGEINMGPVTVLSDMGILFTSVFFFYSGYGLIRSYVTKDNYIDGFLRKRLVIIIVPFFITNLLYLVPGITDGRITNLYGFLSSLFGFTLINTNAWYVIEIIILYIVFYLSFKYVKDKKKSYYLVVFATLLLVLIGLLLPHDKTILNGHWFRGEWWFNSTILFAVGLFFGRNRDRIAEGMKKRYVFLLLAGIVIFVFCAVLENITRYYFGYYHETYSYMAYSDKLITYLAQTLLCISFIMLILLVTLKIRFDNVVLKKVSIFTFELYLVHDLLMNDLSYDDRMPRTVMYAIVLIGSTLLAIALHYIDIKIIEVVNNYLNKEYDNGETFEAKQRKGKVKKVINVIIGVYAILFVLLIVCFITDVVKKFFIEPQNTIEKVKTIGEAGLYDRVEYGHFDTEYMTNGDEELYWIVVGLDENKVLLLCENTLFGMYYNQEHKAVDYESSDIREIIIEDLKYEMLSRSERKYLDYDDECGDTCFILSQSQIDKFNIPNNVLVAKPSEMAKRWGVNVDGQDKHSWWWLRGETSDKYAPVVNSMGQYKNEYQEVNRPSGGVRPAIWVKIN